MGQRAWAAVRLDPYRRTLSHLGFRKSCKLHPPEYAGLHRQADDASPREPTPGLARLGELVERATSADLQVDVHTEGGARELPDGVDRAGYRIIQEALTNTTRHANAAAAGVHVSYGERELHIRVDDDGNGPPGDDAGSGHGIAGMRERAESLGGTLEAGPRIDGGFRVAAKLPLEPGRRAVGEEAR